MTGDLANLPPSTVGLPSGGALTIYLPDSVSPLLPSIVHTDDQGSTVEICTIRSYHGFGPRVTEPRGQKINDNNQTNGLILPRTCQNSDDVRERERHRALLQYLRDSSLLHEIRVLILERGKGREK